MQGRIASVLEEWDLEIYHKLYNRDNKPVAFISDNEYRDVLVNDQYNACAFLVNDTERRDERRLMQANIMVIFTLNLSGSQREDEAAKVKAYQAVNSALWKVKEIKKTIPVIFQGFDINGLEYRDMQPFFNFAFQCEVFYSLSECI
jgi:hypothetical protein